MAMLTDAMKRFTCCVLTRNVVASVYLAVRLDDDAVAKVVDDQRLVSLGQPVTSKLSTSVCASHISCDVQA